MVALTDTDETKIKTRRLGRVRVLAKLFSEISDFQIEIYLLTRLDNTIKHQSLISENIVAGVKVFPGKMFSRCPKHWLELPWRFLAVLLQLKNRAL